MEIFEASRDLVCLCLSGRVSAINQAGLRLLNRENVDEFVGQSFGALAQACDGRDLDVLLSTRFCHGQALPVRLTANDRLLSLTIFYAGEIAPDAAVLIGHDISREEQLADAAREQSERFAVLVDNAMNMVCHVCDGTIRYINGAGIAALGAASAEAVIGRPLAALLHEDYADILSPELIDSMVEDNQHVPMRIRRDDGGMVDAQVKFTRLPSRDGRQLMVEIRDITATNNAVLALKHSGETLERRVKERTAELAREKEMLEQANHHINEGIRYASRLQKALLPEANALDGVVAEFAVGWRPRDIVSGDYYWVGRSGSHGIIALFDCTGHGVPGAFMTAVAASALAQVLQHQANDDPAEILTHLNRLVRAALRQDREGAVSNDGLDAALCVIDPVTGQMRFAGANLPLLIRTQGEFKLLRGDRMCLGYVETPDDYEFSRHEFQLTAGDTCFLYTDGVIDQVGGPQRRLFGRKRLIETLEGSVRLPLEDQLAALFQRLDAWQGNEVRRDDMTALAFRPRASATQMALL
jgi:PAS domain S-box-containing protein